MSYLINNKYVFPFSFMGSFSAGNQSGYPDYHYFTIYFTNKVITSWRCHKIGRCIAELSDFIEENNAVFSWVIMKCKRSY